MTARPSSWALEGKRGSARLRRARVLIVVTRLIRGGAQREALDLLAGLDRSRFDVTVACHPDGDWVERASGLVDAFYPIPDLVRPISPVRDARALCQLLRVLRKGRFDVVHTHTSKAGLLGRLAARLAGVPVIVHTPHGTVFHESYLSAGAQQIALRAERLAARWTDCIITKSEHERKEYVQRRIAPPSKFLTIHSGIDLSRLDAVTTPPSMVRDALGVENGRLLVLYATRFVPEKDHGTFLRAFERVMAAVPNALAVLAGEGPLRLEVEAQAAGLMRYGALLSLGFRDDLPDLMRAADVCVSASLSEGLPLMVVEALALGRPVVATDAGGTRDVICDGVTGRLVPCADPHALADAILETLRKPAGAARMAATGRARMRAGSDVGLMVRRTEELYRECLSRKRAEHGMTHPMRKH